MLLFPFRACSARTEGTKKTATTDLIAAREKPIWYISRRVNWVRRFGAFSWGQPKKLPWDEAIAAELALCLPANVESPSGLGCPEKAKPDGAHPSFARCLITAGTFRGPKSATRSMRTSHPLKWSWHLMPDPGLTSRPKGECVGEVIEQGRKRSGAGREAQEDPVAPRISGKRSRAQMERKSLNPTTNPMESN